MTVKKYWVHSARVLVALLAAVVLAAACGGSSDVSADAGEDFETPLGEAPEFDGCGSSGDGLSYTWTIIEAPADMADDASKLLRDSISDCSFVLESAMEVADVGSWVVELSVTDGETTASDRVTVIVS